MQMSVADAKARRADLVRRAKAGKEVALAMDGHAVARLVALEKPTGRLNRRKPNFAVPTRTVEKAAAGVATARSQDLAPSRCWSTKPSLERVLLVQASYVVTGRLPHCRHLRVRVVRYDLSMALIASVSALPSSSRSAASRRRLVQVAASGRPVT